MNALKTVVEHEWTNIPEDFVVKSCNKFGPRLEAMLAADGDHFERLLPDVPNVL